MVPLGRLDAGLGVPRLVTLAGPERSMTGRMEKDKSRFYGVRTTLPVVSRSSSARCASATALGLSLEPVPLALCAWGQRHAKVLKRVGSTRRKRDQARGTEPGSECDALELITAAY